MAGKFIVFEGGEGCGKSTQVKILADRLKKEGYKVVITREPGDKNLKIPFKIREILLAKKDRLDPKCELFLFLAERAQHVEELIKPALARGKIVISDRFDPSTFAYQHFGRGLNYKFIENLNNYAKDNLQPDLSILLDIPPEIGLSRRFHENKDLTRFEKEDLEFHQKVNWGFRRLAKMNSNWLIIDATLSISEIAEKVWKAVEKLLK